MTREIKRNWISISLLTVVACIMLGVTAKVILACGGDPPLPYITWNGYNVDEDTFYVYFDPTNGTTLGHYRSKLGITATEADDKDIRYEGESRTEHYDTIVYSWITDGNSVNSPGSYACTHKWDDVASITDGGAGSRDDAPLYKSATIVVEPTPAPRYLPGSGMYWDN